MKRVVDTLDWVMPRPATLETSLAAIETALGKLRADVNTGTVIRRLMADLAAARFHLRRPGGLPPLVAILGGTGTGKSTLLNRLLDADIAAASFKRTFTAGAVAVTSDSPRIPSRWLGVEHSLLAATDLPARGQGDLLSIVIGANPLIQKITLIDTPDLDGDQPAHHAQADRVFRWADAVVFLVTPEKYQMTELLPYYRLAARYDVPALHVMNKAEEQAAVDDYRQQIEGATVYVIPRDDAGYEPPADARLPALREAIASLSPREPGVGNIRRAIDLMSRLRDQIIEPTRQQRRAVDGLIKSIRAMETAAPGVDVNPLTHQLQRRLQQRSVLYLMGPGRVLDRVRQVPGMLARLPRTTWDLLRTGKTTGNGDSTIPPDISQRQPEFRTVLSDQMAIVQSRIDDAIRSTDSGRLWIEAGSADYAGSKLDPAVAGQIADEEIAQLQQWLEKQWNSTPRDTAMIEKLLRLLPGGAKLSKWSEAAPYILAVVVAAHHAFFGPIDLMILGGWSLATWLTEKISNQVAARARQTNSAIATRFSRLAHQQIDRTCAWLDAQAPTAREIQNLTLMADRISESLQESEPSAPSPSGGGDRMKL